MRKVPRQYLTKEEAAPHLGITPEALYKRTQRREVPFYKVGRRIFFDLDELLECWAKNKQEPIR